jgi:TPR repeat protein
VIWLVRFLEAWCDKEQLLERAKSQIGALAKPEYSPKAAYYYAEALAQTGKLDWESEYELTCKTREFLELRDKNLARELSPSDLELFEQVGNFIDKEKYEQAKKLLLQIKQPDGAVYLSLASCYGLSKNFAEAEHYLLMAIEKGGEIEVISWGLLGNLYHTEFKDYLKAEHYYLMAIGKGNKWAMFNLAWLYHTYPTDRYCGDSMNSS